MVPPLPAYPNDQILPVRASVYFQGVLQDQKEREEMKKKVTPTDDRILIKPLDPLEQTKGGIILPTQAQEKQNEGTVIDVGPGKRNSEGVRVQVDLEVGQTVLYSKYAGTEIKINGDDHVIVRETDCIALTSVVQVEAEATA